MPHKTLINHSFSAGSQPWTSRISARILFLLALGLGIVVLILMGIKFGAVTRPWVDIFKALSSSTEDETLRYFILYLRLPKVMAALMVGAALAVSGVILQNILNNPLASSFTLGLSQGAALGASFSMIVLTSTAGLAGISIVALGAFCGALTAALLILAFSLVRGMTPQGLILAGVALSTLFGAATMSLQYFASDQQIAATVYWTFGDLSKGGWREALMVGGVMCLGLIFALRRSLDYDALRWGDAQAQALGVAVLQLRCTSLLAAALMTAMATAFYGVIGFVGLVAPHMIRLVFPHASHLFLLSSAALFGAFFLLAADLVAQSILYPTLLPIGIICAFTGVPMFLYLLFRGAGRNA